MLNFDMAVFDASFGGSGGKWGKVGESGGNVGVFLYRVPIFRDFLVKSGDFLGILYYTKVNTSYFGSAILCKNIDILISN